MNTGDYERRRNRRGATLANWRGISEAPRVARTSGARTFSPPVLVLPTPKVRVLGATAAISRIPMATVVGAASSERWLSVPEAAGAVEQ